MPQKGRDQALGSEFFSGIVERFGHAVGVDRECVSREKQAFVDRTIPSLEKS